MAEPKKLLNRSEEKTLFELERVAKFYGGRVFAGPRLSRVLQLLGQPLDKLKLDRDDFDYGTRAEVDFYVEFPRGGGFAVEFDGPHHGSDPVTIVRDAKKDKICRSARLELLRISDDFISRRDQIALLAWVIEARFLLLQHNLKLGDHALGESPFLISEQTFSVTGNLFQNVDRIVRRNGRRAQRWMAARGPDGKYHSLAAATVVGDYIIYGTGRCSSFRFATIHPAELAYELAYFNLATKLEQFDDSRYLNRVESDKKWSEVYDHDYAFPIAMERQEELIRLAMDEKQYKNLYLLKDYVYEGWERDGRPPLFLPGEDAPTVPHS